MSMGPVQTGSAGPGDDVDGDRAGRAEQRAQHRRRRPRPRGGRRSTSPRGRPPSVTRPRPASSVSRAVSRTCAPAPATAGSRPRGSRGAQQVEVVEDLLGELRASVIAGRPGAGPRPAAAPGCRRAPGRRGRRSVHTSSLGLLVDGQRAVVGVRAGQDLQQRRVEAQRSAPSCRGHARTISSTSVPQLGHPRLVGRLDVEPQQRLGVARPAG